MAFSSSQDHLLHQPREGNEFSSQLTQRPAFVCSRWMLMMQKVPSWPLEAKKAVLKTIRRSKTPDQESESNESGDFLLHPYLGRRGQTGDRGLSLPDLPIRVEQMEEMNMDIRAYARAMGEALAVMYWSAGIDAEGVEYVLAPLVLTSEPKRSIRKKASLLWTRGFDKIAHRATRPRRQLDAGSSEEALTEEQSPTDSTSEMATSTGEPGSAAPFQSAIIGAHTVWLLDFDKCQVLPRERQAV
jgi:hypothetical protein